MATKPKQTKTKSTKNGAASGRITRKRTTKGDPLVPLMLIAGGALGLGAAMARLRWSRSTLGGLYFDQRGMAAALSVGAGSDPAELDAHLLRARLGERGANLSR